MLPSCSAEGTNKQSYSRGSGATGGHFSPKMETTLLSTPTRNVPAFAAAAAQFTRSPNVTMHQPYRSIPLSMFGVESELQGYTGVNAENLVTVKPAYKIGVSRTSCHGVPGGGGGGGSGSANANATSLQANRSAQRSPIAVFDNNDAHVAHINSFSGGTIPSAISQGLTNNSNGTNACAGVNGGGGTAFSRLAPICRAVSNKRVLNLAIAERDSSITAGETTTCPYAMHIAETEEKHLNYTAVELPLSQINTGDTAERLRRLHQRRRQVQYGKETLGYKNYTFAVPNRYDREFRNPMHPMTPRPEYDCSKRTFDRYLNTWRRQLHLWDNYNHLNPEPQFTRIGIPTLRRLGLELAPSTPEGHQGSLHTFTATTGQSGGTACTPVTTRQTRRDTVVSTAQHQRSAGYQHCGAPSASSNAAAAAAAGVLLTSISMMPNARPLSGCGGGGWSLTNTPHTPYHGSTNSTSSYPPPLVSVLEQPTFFSPHWADSSRQSSPNPHCGRRSSCCPHHTSVVGSSAAAAAAGGASVGHSINTSAQQNAQCNPAFWETGGYFNNNNNNNNGNGNSGYSVCGYGSPYGGHRYTPHSIQNHYYHHHPTAPVAGNTQGNSAGHELWVQTQRTTPHQ